MNHKFSIGVVVAIVLQVSGFVWWTAQQAQTIDMLKGEVEELTAKSAVVDEVNIKRDVNEMKAKLQEHEDWISENYADIEALIEFAKFTENKWATAYDEDPGYERQFGFRQPVE
jgi:D-mannonate dehydratase